MQENERISASHVFMLAGKARARWKLVERAIDRKIVSLQDD